MYCYDCKKNKSICTYLFMNVWVRNFDCALTDYSPGGRW